MSDIKLVLTDVDGTIVVHDSYEISQKVLHAVTAAENVGVTVIPVTGRPYEMLQDIFIALNFDDVSVVDAGATIRNAKDGAIVWQKWLEPAILKQVVPIIGAHCTLIDYEPGFIERTPQEIDIDAIHEEAPYVFARISTDVVAEVEQQLSKIENIVTHIQHLNHVPGKADIHVTHVEADKYHGVQALLKIKNIKSENVMAIGDGNNDLPLFRSAGLKIAMGNASERLKAEADYVVGPVQEDGFAEAIERFVLASVDVR